MTLTPLFGPIGPEILIILFIIILLFGGNKLPQLAQATGKSLGEFKKGVKESDNPIAIDDNKDTSAQNNSGSKSSQDSNPQNESEVNNTSAESNSDDTGKFQHDNNIEDDNTQNKPDKSLKEIQGIGDVYQQKLNAIDIHTVQDLSDADSETITDKTTISEKTVNKWVREAEKKTQKVSN